MNKYNNSGINLDNYFLIRETAKRADVHYSNNGVDISERYESLKRSQRIPPVAYSRMSTNFSDMFMGNPAQYTISNRLSSSRTTQWFVELSYNFDVVFTTQAHYQQFFYYGGRIRISSAHNNTSTPKNTSWSQLLSGVGVVEIAETETYQNDRNVISAYGATNITSTYRTVYTATSGVYTDNYFRVSIKRTSPTVLTVLVTYYDGLSGNIDEPVAGSTICYISERRYPTVPVPGYVVIRNLSQGN